jgi:hypothetical protein
VGSVGGGSNLAGGWPGLRRNDGAGGGRMNRCWGLRLGRTGDGGELEPPSRRSPSATETMQAPSTVPGKELQETRTWSYCRAYAPFLIGIGQRTSPENEARLPHFAAYRERVPGHRATPTRHAPGGRDLISS